MVKHSEPRPAIYSTGESLMRKYSERELQTIQRTVRKWKKPSIIYPTYWHVTDREKVDSIFEHGLLPNRIDACVFMTREPGKLDDYAKKYRIIDPVILEIDGAFKLNKNLFRQSGANPNAHYDVAYLEAIKPEFIKIKE